MRIVRQICFRKSGNDIHCSGCNTNYHMECLKCLNFDLMMCKHCGSSDINVIFSPDIDTVGHIDDNSVNGDFPHRGDLRYCNIQI